MPITSPKNSLLQEIRRAAAAGRPTENGLVVAEGPHLLEEALRGKWGIERVLVSEWAGSRFGGLLAKLPGAKAGVLEVSERAFGGMTTTETHQGVITLLRPQAWTWADLRHSEGLVVVLDGIQDPGNAGTILRSAEAFGATGAVFLQGCVHVANGKLLRASAGSVFRIPILENVEAEMLLSEARREGMTVYALAADGREDLSRVDLTRRCALVLGGEGAGVSATIDRSAIAVRISVEVVESLNVGIAGSIALFEAARQRRKR